MGDLGGLEVTVEVGSTGVDAYAKLANHHASPVRCDVLFKSGPESRRRSARLAPENSRLFVGGLMREVIKLKVSVVCSPAG